MGTLSCFQKSGGGEHRSPVPPLFRDPCTYVDCFIHANEYIPYSSLVFMCIDSRQFKNGLLLV